MWATDDVRRTLWINQILQWEPLYGQQTGRVGAITWFGERPWAVFRVKEIVYHVNVTEYVRAKGL